MRNASTSHRPMTGDLDGTSWDVVVVGAGPAGSMAALELSRRDRSVLLVDRKAFPRWKVCGACLNRGAIEVLTRVGLGSLVPELGGVPLTHLHLRGWREDVDLPLQGSFALSRIELDRALVVTAERAGARFADRTTATLGPLVADARQVRLRNAGVQRLVQARAVVAADGLGGTLVSGRAGGTGGSVMPGSRIGVGALVSSVVPGFPAGSLTMVVGSGGYVGLTRLESNRLNLAAALDPSSLSGGVDDAVQSILIGAGLRPLPPDPGRRWTGTPALTRRPKALGTDRVFCVGDAAGYVEPFTGEGMSWALAGAHALAPLVDRAVDAWDPHLLSEWGRWHRTGMGPSQRLCGAVSWTLRHPRLSRGTLRVLRRFPQAARPFLQRASTPPSFPSETVR